MRIEQKFWKQESGWTLLGPRLVDTPQIVLVFGGRVLLEDPVHFNEIQSMYLSSHIIQCSTAGEIIDTHVYDDSMTITAIFFEKTTLQFATANIMHPEESEAVGKELATSLPKDQLQHVIVFSDGLHVNGTKLVLGINSALPPNVAVTGGLVGDGANFKKTVLGLDSPAEEGKAVAIGFYGSALKVGYGSLGGWDPFGIERIITKSENNVLYELDGKPALDIYETYLGDQAKDLPSSGLLFPLRLRIKSGDGEVEVVRTILAVDKEARSMTFAGDMPLGVPATLMKANFDRLVAGAAGASTTSLSQLGDVQPELAILISCVGRKLVLRERIEEEIEAVRSTLGGMVKLTGFYSYGELCPSVATEKQCQLHNQTMTITTFAEVI